MGRLRWRYLLIIPESVFEAREMESFAISSWTRGVRCANEDVLLAAYR